MEKRIITVNGNKYEFINSSRSTRNGFAHDTELLKNDYYNIGRGTAHYINRTWECYRYQTVMRRCIDNIIEEKYNNFIVNYKAKNNIKRITAEKRAEANKLFEDLAEVKELREVYNELNRH